MSKSVQTLLEILDLEMIEVNLFRGYSPKDTFVRVFGGQVIGQALVAASRTVDARAAHSLHAYFLLGGDPKAPIIYEVDRIRDGKSFTTRWVKAIQHGEAIFSMGVSFHREEDGHDHQAQMPDVPMPEALASERDIREKVMPLLPEAVRKYYQRDRPIELRPVEYMRYLSKDYREPRFNVWIKSIAPLPDDPIVHRCVLAYASDMGLLDTSLIPHGRSVFSRSIQPASLDHALWFHRPFRMDEWLLYSQDSPNANNARGFSRGQFFTRDGVLVASVAQEGLIRKRDPNFEKKP
jgi:acyl-CoA thioesterase-2